MGCNYERLHLIPWRARGTYDGIEQTYEHPVVVDPPAGAGPGRQPKRAWSLLRIGWAKGGRAVWVLSVWLLVERLSTWLQHIRPVQAQAMLRFSVTRHRGKGLVLKDGTEIVWGDPIIELHFDNRRLVELTRTGTSPWPLIQIIRADLAALATRLSSEGHDEIKALHGVTLFAPAGVRLGFEVHPLPRTWRLALERFFMAGLVILYNPAGWRAAGPHAARWPGELWMSRATLMRRYGSGGPSNPQRLPISLVPDGRKPAAGREAQQ
jgi:hypothetical protein